MPEQKFETTPDPESTWGATPAYKDAWAAKHGDKVRQEVAKENEAAEQANPTGRPEAE